MLLNILSAYIALVLFYFTMFFIDYIQNMRIRAGRANKIRRNGY